MPLKKRKIAAHDKEIKTFLFQKFDNNPNYRV